MVSGASTGSNSVGSAGAAGSAAACDAGRYDRLLQAAATHGMLYPSDMEKLSAAYITGGRMALMFKNGTDFEYYGYVRTFSNTGSVMGCGWGPMMLQRCSVAAVENAACRCRLLKLA
jgi:hypothetical protein